MRLEEKTLNSELIYQGRIISLYKDTALLENDKTAVREVIDHPGGVCILAVDDDDNILFVKQFRYPLKTAMLEIPAGKLERGEDSYICGKRELEEETGYTCSIYKPLGTLYPTPAYLNEIIYIYYASGLVKSEQRLDEDEFLSVEKIPYQKAVEMVLSGDITDAKTQIAIMKYKIMRDEMLI
ncbi:MAG TPA: ADP-ribose pyrophosphatase [Ruminococcaceae bacterium]|nr:ADP-ribose pyrophosphatase [Oscillospiraceae bacterium]